jgi:hypothetical protein
VDTQVDENQTPADEGYMLVQYFETMNVMNSTSKRILLLFLFLNKFRRVLRNGQYFDDLNFIVR